MTQQHNPLHWYETNLPARERKLRGHFSTPPFLVDQILDACGYTPERNISRIRVLDPACGSGNFLAGATRRLLAYGKQHNLSNQQLVKYIQHNIWGFDPDPIACMLAELQLHSTFSATHPQEHPLQRLHIHQADGLAFPWEQRGNIDLFLANPPYLASKNTDLSGYRSTHQHGQSDSYLLFLNLALQIVRPRGWIGLVLPDSMLARANATRERERLLAETTVHHIWHLADVFTAYVGAVVIIAQKKPPQKQHVISWQRSRWTEHQDSPKTIESSPNMDNKVSQLLLRRQPGAELRYLLSTVEGTLIECVHNQLHSMQVPNQAARTLAPLGECILIRRGEELGKSSQLLNKEIIPTTSTQKQPQWYPILRGGIDIHPYEIPKRSGWIAREYITKPLERYLKPKILLVKSAGQLRATLDLQGHIVLQTLYILQLNEQHPWKQNITPPQFTVEDELYFLLALLNSRLLQKYIYVVHTAYKWVQPQIEQYVLSQLPIPINSEYTAKERIISRARLLMQTCSPSSPDVELETLHDELYEEQERAIYVLYETALQHKYGSKISHTGVKQGVSLHD
jgi:SAM-dependent methyltransferase